MKPVARAYVNGRAGLQLFESREPDARPITSPYEVDGNFKFIVDPFNKPWLTIETLSTDTTVRTSVPGAGPGRLDGGGLTDDGKVLIIRRGELPGRFMNP